MQQSESNISLLQEFATVFEPFVLEGVSEKKQRAIGNQYREIQTITHSSFDVLLPIFHNRFATSVALKPDRFARGVVAKPVCPDIKDYLSPQAVAMWFCTDGGRRDYGVNEGKAIQFHTQGFDDAAQENLAKALRDRYSWNASVRPDYVNEKGQKFSLVQIEASSFENFVEVVEPFILPYFKKRLPKPRKPGSRFSPLNSLDKDKPAN